MLQKKSLGGKLWSEEAGKWRNIFYGIKDPSTLEMKEQSLVAYFKWLLFQIIGLLIGEDLP